MTARERTAEAVSPHLLAQFWAEAVGYKLQNHSAFVQRLLGLVARAASSTGSGAAARLCR